MKKFIQDSWLVIVSSLVFGLLVAGVDGALRERINQNKLSKRDKNMTDLMGGNCSFAEKTVKDAEGKELVYFEAQENGNTTGYCFTAEGAGFADRIELIVAVDSKFEKCKGFAVMYSQETPGFGDKIVPVGEGTFSDEFKGSPCPTPSKKLVVSKVGDKTNREDTEIVAITGATISSEAVTKIVNDSILLMRELLLQK